MTFDSAAFLGTQALVTGAGAEVVPCTSEG
jgi:hypothetical protein